MGIQHDVLIPSSLLRSISEYLWYWAFDVESLTVESCTIAEVVAQQRVAWCLRSWYIGVATQPIRSGSGGVSRVFHIPGPTPNLV